MSTIINGTSSAITFPDSSVQNTAFTGSAATLTSGTLPAARLPAGSVLQMVQATATSSTSTTSGSLVTTGFSASITPQFSTSKIYVIFNGRVFNNSANGDSQLAIYRGATNIQSASSLYNAGSAAASLQTLIVLDSPATTSSTTYTMYFSIQNAGTTYLNVNGASDGTRSLTLMEIAA